MSNAGTRPRQAKHKKYMLVRYGRMGSLGFFEHNEINIPKVPTRVVVKTEKGLELGHLVGQLTTYKGGHFKLGPEQISEYFGGSEVDLFCERTGRFIRYASDEDVNEEKHLEKISEEEIETCRHFIEELNLPMKIIGAEHIFGGERIIFYFMSESRVDFRELVKKLAGEYQTRIEMRQIGSRDEAKLLGDVESCGQPCCCRRFLKVLKPVNMRMAKMQKATLDPSKISGFCGRLKCCLRYEDKTYTELKQLLPGKGTVVKTPHGQGKVVDTQIMAQLVMVEREDGTRVAVHRDELEVISAPAISAESQDRQQEGQIQDGEEEQREQQEQ